MKKFLIILLFAPIVYGLAQNSKIDFRTVDVKYLNTQQRKEFQQWRDRQFQMMKSTGLQTEIKSVIIQGNKIRSIIYNTGAISNPGVSANVLDLVWNGLGYGYEFGPLVGARVPKEGSSTDSVSIVVEGFGGANKSTADGDFAPDGVTKWGWLPKPGYSAPGQNEVASWGARGSDFRIKPSSWPESWYNPILGEYIYPSFLGGNSSVPDEEVYFVVDDSTDAEFEYYPFVSDSSHRGLGFNLEVRVMQFSNPLAEDIIFLVYSAENDVKSKTLPEVYFGMFGDPHVGGASNYPDDVASFIPARTIGIPDFDKLIYASDGKLTNQRARNMVYTWDDPAEGKSDIPAYDQKMGYFGYKFLESPNNSIDGIDNDDDGITDEGPFNDKGTYIDGIIPLTTGISDTTKYKATYGAPKPRWSGDEDGDWNKDRDDVGVDGIANTLDFGEGNGVPDQLIGGGGEWKGSEPNFGFRDVSESDQIGLRSFWSLTYSSGSNHNVGNKPGNDNLMYEKISSEMDTAALSLLYTTNTENVGDYVFLYGSGPFRATPGHRERFSIALLMGLNLSDLLLNSETAQRVLEANYTFAQPPPKPVVKVVPGDGRVTLYWDNSSENGIDPLTNQNDFEGYKIYRSEDYTFQDVFTITDGFGFPYIGQPLYDSKAQRSAQWHKPWSDSLKNVYKGGYHPAEYVGRYIKYYMGDPDDVSGLRHEYVDSTVTNGKTYYYAVVAFDHGVFQTGLELPPTETQTTILRNPITQEFKFDVNTVVVVPNKPAADLMNTNPVLNESTPGVRERGYATGKISFKILDEQNLIDGSYSIGFTTSDGVMTMNVHRNTVFLEQFKGNDTSFVNLANTNIAKLSLKVFPGTDTNGTPLPSERIIIDSAFGRLKTDSLGLLKKTNTYTVMYNYYPVAGSTNLNNQDGNPIFDGIRPYVTDDPLDYNKTASILTSDSLYNLTAQFGKATAGTERRAPFDVRIEFFSRVDTSGNFIPIDSIGSSTSPFTKTVKIPFRIFNATDTTTLSAFVIDSKANKQWDVGEEIVILTPPPYKVGASDVMMGIQITRSDTVKHPIVAGAKFTAKMKKPFTVEDKFIFTTKAIRYDPNKANTGLNNIYVVPNPYVIASTFEQPSYRPDLRGDRVIQFRNLPKECTIRIYTITGELVQTLRKNDVTNYVNWDVLSSESARIGYGVYIYHVETPNGGTKIGRLGIIK